MTAIRVIPRLDIKGPNLVKGIHLEGLRVLGDPAHFARHYYENGADELIYQDVVASLYGRNSLHDIISKTARQIFIPLTVGGGLRSIDDIREVLRAGADKVALNTAAIRNPQFIQDASQKFGSSTIVVAIEAIRQGSGEYFAYVDNGREETGLEVVSWARQAEDLGAGEILVTAVDNEGTGSGFNIDLIERVAKAVSVPVIAHGGPGKCTDVPLGVAPGRADAVALASVLHYGVIELELQFSKSMLEGNDEFLRSRKQFSKIAPCTIADVKRELMRNSLETRTV